MDLANKVSFGVLIAFICGVCGYSIYFLRKNAKEEMRRKIIGQNFVGKLSFFGTVKYIKFALQEKDLLFEDDGSIRFNIWERLIESLKLSAEVFFIDSKDVYQMEDRFAEIQKNLEKLAQSEFFRNYFKSQCSSIDFFMENILTSNIGIISKKYSNFARSNPEKTVIEFMKLSNIFKFSKEKMTGRKTFFSLEELTHDMINHWGEKVIEE